MKIFGIVVAACLGLAAIVGSGSLFGDEIGGGHRKGGLRSRLMAD